MLLKETISLKKNNSLHIKFLVVSTILLSLVSFGIYKYFTEKYEKVITNEREGKEKLVLNQIAALCEKNISRIKTENFKSDLESITRETGLRHLIIANEDSALQEISIKDFYEIDSTSEAQNMIIYSKDDIYASSKTFSISDSLTLSIYYEFSRSNMNLKIQKSKVQIGFATLLIFSVSFLVLFAGSYIIMYPLQKLADSALEISTGNLTKKIPNKRKNEFSNIALSINTLSEELVKANAQIEKLNKELKYQFRDKIGELNYEINKKRQAESLLKQSEEQFRLLFELAPIGMVISSVYGKIMKVNAAFNSVVGYTEDEIIGMQIKELTHADDREFDIQLHDNLLEGKQQNAYYEKRLVRKDGEVIYVIVEAVAVKDKLGKPSHFIEQIIDITARKRTEQELILAKEKAEESDRLKTAFLAQMSHEIRTPLNVILAAMSLIQDDLDETDEETKTILDSVSSAGKRLQRTIDLILNISAVQSGSYKPSNEAFNLAEDLKIMVEEFKTFENEKDLTISYLNKSKNSYIEADHYSVLQIFQNLIGNAIKYTIKGSVEVLIEDLNDDKLQVMVKDTGIGISKDYIARMFSPFSQEDVGHKREFEGNGLGLALVKKYVEINNAEILVESEKNKGSVFTVILNKKRIAANKLNQKVSLESDDIIELV